MKLWFFSFVCISMLGLDLVSSQGTDEISRVNKYNLEERADYPGFTKILSAISGLLQSVIAVLTGQGSVDDVTQAVQGVFFEVSRMVSVQGIVGQIPVIGFILQPIVGIAAMILSNAPLLGGLISFALVGMSPSEPAQ